MNKLFLSLLLCLLLACSQPESGEPPVFQLQEGFQIEEIYHPSAQGQKSWVSITVDPKGRLIASAQDGYLYRFEPPAPGKKLSKQDVEQIELEIGHAQGLLWAFNSLYVSVNSRKGIDGHSSGLYRLRDTDGDDKLDEIDELVKLDGQGEHGPHAIRLSPDGQSLYFIAGNHTKIPGHFSSRLPKNWGEDNLFPPFKDARGHAANIKAPGGWIAKTDPEGKEWELISAGYRNAYDMDFNDAGELFVFDSDMEWDLGTPWYRPIRLCHAVSGSEFGWRTGSGKWPDYYPDNLPSVVDVGQGSPTGVLMGRGAAFPARYQQGLFIFDWSFGTIYMVNLHPSGSSYTGELEEFLSGRPFPVADGVVGNDGALYLVSGGRGLDSRVFRVSYTGNEPTDPVEADTETGAELRALRHRLEAFHNRQDPAAVDTAWPYLGHDDRFIRYAARIAIEHQPVNSWKARALSEKDPRALIHAVLALARQGSPDMQDAALAALSRLDFGALAEADQLNLLRVYDLLFIRMGPPAPAWKQRLAQELEPFYPANSDFLNRELCQTLAYLESPHVIEKTLALIEQEDSQDVHPQLISAEVAARDLERYDYGEVINQMSQHRPPTQDLFLVKTLSYVKSGWTNEQRRRYFQWFYEAMKTEGGMSFKGFLEQVRLQAMENVPEDLRPEMAEIAGMYDESAAANLAELPRPQGPGKNYNPSDIREILNEKADEARSFENGKRMYQAALCQACHQMRGEGGNVGPDLTQIATRFSTGDIIQALVSPSASITDQYAATHFTLKDGKTLVGRVLQETDSEVFINQNPYDPNQKVGIPKDQIESRELSPISIMPPGLLNRLNEEEVADLMAYLLAGGDPQHEIYQKPVQ
ncbi:MAG: heme-binding protein [Bacteroidetes bacterium]|nr:MAG: heme-binding protein [Bacteroidota bacterium]